MDILYEKIVRPLLFLKEAERAHIVGVGTLRFLSRLRLLCRAMEYYNLVRTQRPIQLFGLTFPNAVGLAAGMDKNGECWQAGAALGFGHVEIGTVTPRPQPGNPRPRIFRYPKAHALINRLGFNNDGADAVACRLSRTRRQRSLILGINIGKNRITPLEKAVEDYLEGFQKLAEHADYFTINISSPNTPGLRHLQVGQRLRELLGPLAAARNSRAKNRGERPIPLLVKIAPDLSFREIDGILETLIELGFDGVVATNTTLQRPVYRGLSPDAIGKETGGLSGKPLESLSNATVKYIYRVTEGKLPIIGVGGIDDLESAERKINAGAHLVQLYTGFVYRGPFLPKVIAQGLASRDAEWI